MAQTGYTPISIYYSATTTNVPTAGNLVAGELAINTADGKLFYKDSSGVVQTIASKGAGTIGGSTTQIQYNLNGSLAGSANFTYDSSGRLLVGTTSVTSSQLNVSSTTGVPLTLDATSGNATNLTFSQAGSSKWYVRNLDTSNAFSFYDVTAGSERMRIDSIGNLLVGNTSAGLTDTNSITLEPKISGGGYAVFNHATGSSSGRQFIYFGYAGGSIGSITQSGTTAVLYNLTSDARLKTNIVDAPIGNIDDIKVRSFDWKSDGSHVEYGFIAQELVEVAPYAVHQPQDPEEMMAVDYSKLVPMMIKEIQDLKQRIKTLDNK